MPQNVTRLALALSALAIATPAAATNVVASIKPVELLVKAVAGDSVEVSTLVPPGSSPHNYSMKPSQRRALEQADVIFWVGPDMETFLNRLLGGKEFAGRAVAFMESEGGESEHDEHHEEHNHEHEDHDDHGHHDEPDVHHHDHGDGEDPHIWVDPMLALDMAKDIRNALSEHEGVNPEELNANLERFQAELLSKEKSIRASFAGLKDISLFAYHDAFTRYADHYDLTLDGHANGMIFKAFDAAGNLFLQETYYSVGGGFVVTEAELSGVHTDLHAQKEEAGFPYPFGSAAEMLEMDDIEARTAQQWNMVSPCWGAHPHTPFAAATAQEFRTHTQSTTTARRLCRDHTAVIQCRMLSAKHQLCRAQVK